MLNTQTVKDASRGQWLSIFAHAGIQFRGNPNHHQACPHCGGKDRFRMDDDNGMGDYFCNGCGAGDGFSLLMKVTGETFPETVKYVAGILGIAEEVNTDPAKLARIRAKAEKENAEREAKRQAEKKARHKQKAEQAQKLWAKAQPATPQQAYLTKKHIQPHGTCTDRYGNLLIPLYHHSGVLMNIQTVSMTADGSKKRPITGARKKGCFYTFGTPAGEPMQDTPEIIAIAEGFSTSASIFEALDGQIPVVMAVDTGNLEPVALALRQRYGKSVRFMFCADNDLNNTKKVNGEIVPYNNGVQSANACVNHPNIGGVMVVPQALPVQSVEQVA